MTQAYSGRHIGSLMFSDVISVHNGNMKHARAIEFALRCKQGSAYIKVMKLHAVYIYVVGGHCKGHCCKIDARSSDFVIIRMSTDRIGRHEVLLPINHKNYNFREKKNSQVMKERENFFKLQL